MKHKLETNKHNKDGPWEKSNYPMRSIISGHSDNDHQSNIKTGFVAWPEKTLPLKCKDDDIEILEGRTKGGGYVAYPKKKVTPLSTVPTDANPL
ncbi:MAG: hypothetical protein ABI594_08295 [Ginsengibacter sp.]